MSSIDQTRIRFDIGRVVMTPLCLLFILSGFNGTYLASITPAPLDTAKVLAVSNRLFVTGFYILMLSAYLLRGPARMTSASLMAKLIAVMTTFFPFLLVFFPRQPQADSRLLFIGSLTLVAGLILSLWSLFALGRNLSIIPQARSLVETGPYRYVRHPLYTGEILSVVGLVVSGFTFPALLVPVILASLQAYRAIEEEKILSNAFGEYRAYMSRTHRFLPGLF